MANDTETMLSPHFSLEEATFSDWAVRNRVDNTPPPDILKNMLISAQKLEVVRSWLGGLPMRIHSWFRCPAVNVGVGSSDRSDHPNGWAIDFSCPKFGTPRQIIAYLITKGLEFDQIIEEGTWVHISFAPKNRKQVLTAVFHPGKPTTYKEGL